MEQFSQIVRFGLGPRLRLQLAKGESSTAALVPPHFNLRLDSPVDPMNVVWRVRNGLFSAVGPVGIYWAVCLRWKRDFFHWLWLALFWLILPGKVFSRSFIVFAFGFDGLSRFSVVRAVADEDIILVGWGFGLCINFYLWLYTVVGCIIKHPLM